MARKRMIDPDFWNDEKLSICTRDERLLFMGLISNADDEGRGRSNHKFIKSIIFPYDEDISSDDVLIMLQDLNKLNLIQLYKVDNQIFFFLPNFKKHQTINKPTPSKLPKPPDVNNYVSSNINTPEPPNISGLEQLPYDYGSHTVGLPPKRKEVKRREVKVKRKEYIVGQKPPDRIPTTPTAEIVNYLNQKTGTSYKPTSKKTQDLIKARLNEGFALQDFLTVIDKKFLEWQGTEFEKFIRPETLFSTKFESYLNQRATKPKSGLDNIRELYTELENEGSEVIDYTGYD